MTLVLKKLIEKFIVTFNNPILRNIGLVALITFIIKVISFFKESLVGSVFGLSLLLDTYFIAILIPSFIQNVFIGAIHNLFIPNYTIEKKTSNNIGGFQTFTILSIASLTLLLSLISIIFVEFFLENSFPGHDESYYSLIRLQFYLVLPCIFFWGYSSFLSALLEFNGNFFISTISQAFMPITVIVLVLFFRDNFNDLVLVSGLTLGSFLAFIFLLVICVRKKIIKIKKLTITENIVQMSKQYLPKVISGLLVGINPFVDQFFAAQLVIGSISSINYGLKLPSFLVSILVIAMGNVLLPHFSRSFMVNEEKAYHQLFKILKYIFSLSLIISGVIFILSEEIISLLFERNEFSSTDTLVVSKIQQIALVYVPFYICTNVIVKFLTSRNKNTFMAWVSFIKLLLNILLNIILMKYFMVYGLVLSTTIVLIISSFIYLFYTFMLYKKVKY